MRRDLTLDPDGLPYEHVYIPIDYPDSMGWTRNDVAAGATVTNALPGHLNIVGTAANNTGYSSSVLFWNGSAGDTRRIRFRARVNSGGSIADDRSRLKFGITDGVNDQEVILRFSTTQVSVLDGPGNVLTTKAVDMTQWVEYLAAFAHDSPAGAGLVSVWRRQQDETFWTVVVTNAAVTEQAGTNNDIRFGGSVAGAVDWDISFLGVADDDNAMSAGFTNPDDLAPRSVPANVDMMLDNGISLGGFNGVGVPGDTFTVGTTYTYGKENLWQEFRPSRHLRSESDFVTWDIVFDAGPLRTFHADSLAIVGSNFRVAEWRMNTALAFPVGSTVNESLNATYDSGAGSTASAGMLVPTTDPGWRKDQFKSTTARKWYLSDNGGFKHLIIGNDTDRLYIEGTPAGGAWIVFGDRMGVTFTEAHVRYARLRVSAQRTAEGYYKLGTLIFDTLLQLSPVYAHNFTDRIEARVTVHESDAGYRSGAKIGPRRNTLSIQWSPMSRYCTDFAVQLEDFYNAVDSSTTPFIFWRDSADQQTIQLVRVTGTYARPNERGELSTALATVEQLVLEEEL